MFDSPLDRIVEPVGNHLPLETLAGMSPGAELGTVLASIGRTQLSGEDRVTVMRAWHRQVAHAQAVLYRSMVAVAYS